jgi:DNA polymerase III alpha subunit
MKLLKIKNYKTIGVQKTYDLEVNSSDHNFYTNGLVTSNSHAVSYSHLTAITAYIKAKYPQAFFLALLKMTKHEQDSLDEINTIEKELPYFNIRLLKPDLKHSEQDFSIEGSNIRYGLGHIKGIADSAKEKLTSFNRENANKFDLFNNCLEAKLGLGIVAPLIHAGCFPDYGDSRAKLLLEYQLYNLLTDREKLLVNKFGEELDYDIFKILKHLFKSKDGLTGKEYIKESRQNTIKKSYNSYKKIYDFNISNGPIVQYLEEKAVLGYSYSSNLVSLYNKEFPEIKTIHQAKTEPEQTLSTVIGTVKSVKQGKSRAKGTPYLSLEIEDDHSSCKVMAFNERMNFFKDENGKFIDEGVIAVVRGKNMSGDVIFADYAKPLWEIKLVRRQSQIK